MVKKTDLAKQAYLNGNIKEALRIAKTFRIGLSKSDRDAIIRGYECLVHPEFYQMLGKNPEVEIQKGIEVFEKKILRKSV